MFRTLTFTLTACVFGLIGYELGRQPDSPDVVGWLKQEAQQVDWQATGDSVAGAVRSGQQSVSQWAQAEPVVSNAPVDQPVREPAASPSAAMADLPPIPQCW